MILIKLLIYFCLKISSSCRGNGNILFLFLCYLIYGCSIVMYFIYFVRYIGVEEYMFGCCCFVSVYVCVYINIVVF